MRYSRVMKIRDLIAEANPDALLADGLDDALFGYDTKGRAVYLVCKILDVFMNRDGMSREVAVEHFHFNVEQAGMGEMTPLYVYDD